jgi:hypothetical protein
MSATHVFGKRIDTGINGWRCGRLWTVPGSLGLCLLAGALNCNAPLGSVTFVAEVPGGVDALRGYQLMASSMSSDPVNPYRFISRAPWSEVVTAEFSLASRTATEEVSSVKLHPFVCQQDPSFKERLQSGEWAAQETHQAFLMPDGTLELDTDFDHLLKYRCDWSSSNGRSQSGSAVLTSAPMLCADATRRDTTVRIGGTLFGSTFDTAPSICSAILTNDAPAKLTVSFSISDATITLNAALQHCVDPNEVLPLVLNAPPMDPSCSIVGSVEVIHSTFGKRVLGLASGQWTIYTLSFLKHGRITGTIDAQYSTGNDSLSLTGAVDLPILRIPVNSGV